MKTRKTHTDTASNTLFEDMPEDETANGLATLPELSEQLHYLRLPVMRSQAADLSRKAAREGWDPLRYLGTLVGMEAGARRDKSALRRIAMARFPVIKTLESFDWTWPGRINRDLVESLFELRFVDRHANVLLFGNPGLGKSHIATALGYSAALAGHSVLFANAIDVVNKLHAAAATHSLPTALRTYAKPEILILDELGYLPLDKRGGDLLFQVISQRYERGSIVLTTNKPPAEWPATFNNDAALATAIIDRLSHHCHTIVIEGKSYRMRAQNDAEPVES